MHRSLLATLALCAALLAPLALAGPPGFANPLPEQGVTHHVGPCYYGYSFTWPGDHVWAGCVVLGRDVGAYCGSGSLDMYCGVKPLLP